MTVLRSCLNPLVRQVPPPLARRFIPFLLNCDGAKVVLFFVGGTTGVRALGCALPLATDMELTEFDGFSATERGDTSWRAEEPI